MQTVFVILIVLFSIAFLSEAVTNFILTSYKNYFPNWILFLGGFSVFMCMISTLLFFIVIVPEKDNEIENLKKQLNERCPQYEEVNETLYKKK